MSDSLQPPDLALAPNLQRLLTPSEVLLFTVRIHPLRGWWLLLLSLACFGASYFWPLAFIPFLLLIGLWYLPLHTNEVAVTNDRLLLRTGWLHLLLETIEDQNIIRWRLEQSALGSMLDTGSVYLLVREAASTREIALHWVSRPMMLLEALQALQDEKFKNDQ